MDPHAPDPDKARELLRRQDELQHEAHDVLGEISLIPLLSALGIPEHIGSSVSGLMVWRDIDIGVRCNAPSPETVFRALLPLLADPRVIRVEFAQETGPRSPSGLPADNRYCVVLHYERQPGVEWKIDLSIWVSPAPRSQLAQIEALKQRLTPETRLTILWIKTIWCTLPVYPYEVGGTEVYDAVLNHGVRTPDEFERYLLDRGLPGRGF